MCLKRLLTSTAAIGVSELFIFILFKDAVADPDPFFGFH